MRKRITQGMAFQHFQMKCTENMAFRKPVGSTTGADHTTILADASGWNDDSPTYPFRRLYAHRDVVETDLGHPPPQVEAERWFRRAVCAIEPEHDCGIKTESDRYRIKLRNQFLLRAAYLRTASQLLYSMMRLEISRSSFRCGSVMFSSSPSRPSSSESCKSRLGETCSAFEMRTSVSRLALREPRSICPRKDRLMPARSANFSCVIFANTRCCLMRFPRSSYNIVLSRSALFHIICS